MSSRERSSRAGWRPTRRDRGRGVEISSIEAHIQKVLNPVSLAHGDQPRIIEAEAQRAIQHDLIGKVIAWRIDRESRKECIVGKVKRDRGRRIVIDLSSGRNLLSIFLRRCRNIEKEITKSASECENARDHVRRSDRNITNAQILATIGCEQHRWTGARHCQIPCEEQHLHLVLARSRLSEGCDCFRSGNGGARRRRKKLVREFGG